MRVCAAVGDVAITASRDRVLLATLLLSAGRPVAAEQLIDAVWGEDPPVTARNQLQTCVSRLRKVLTAVGAAADLRTHPAGYVLDVSVGGLDAVEFDRLVGLARAAAEAGELVRARDGYRAALGLWRGPALAGLSSAVVRRGAAAWDERRYATVEDRIDVELRLGGEREIVAELAELVQRHPVRERLRAQLMTALCRAGRRAEALAVYRAGRQVMADELGIEPGAALQELHQRILTGDEPLAEPSPPPSVVPVCCLPRPVADFTGRAESVAFLLAGAVETTTGPVVQLIDGMAGSGKTALAVHAAHLAAGQFPHAQLFIDLYGHGERNPLEPGAALVTLLRQLGVPSERIPADADARVALWRNEVSRRRMLIVLDNAASSAQVAPLLPTTGQTMAIVTSRRRLSGLDGVRPRTLPLLDPDEATALLGRIAGAQRVAAEPDAAAEVVRRCGYLPLAIRLAGARLAHRPGWRVADLADRLGHNRPLLPELAAEDRTVADAFALSYTPLTADQQRMFRLLSIHPGEWLDDHAAAALTDLPLDQTRTLLDALVDRHLIEEPQAGRYRLHDLVREYAATLAVAGPEGTRAPLERLLDYYTHAVLTATAPLESAARRRLRYDKHTETPKRPDLAVYPAENANAWLDRERSNLVRLVQAANQSQLHEAAGRLARACFRFFNTRGYNDDILASQRYALASAEAVGDRTAAGLFNNYLAAVHFRQGNLEKCADFLSTAVMLQEAEGPPEHAVNSRANLAAVYAMLGQPRQAIAQLDQAFAVSRKSGDLARLQYISQIQTEVHLIAGRLVDALDSARTDLALARQIDDLSMLAMALSNVGAARLRLGHLEPAGRLLVVALAIKRRISNRNGEVETLNDLAVLHRARGQYDSAVALHREALAIAREIGSRYAGMTVLNDLASTLHSCGDQTTAAALYRLVIDETAGRHFPRPRADAFDGLARCLVGQNDQAASRCWREALQLYQRLEAPKADEVLERLESLGCPGGPPRSEPRRDEARTGVAS